MPRPIMVDSLLELVGGTPLVRLNRIVPPNAATVWLKCEHLNPGGSVKDRIALAMIESAEQSSLIAPGRSTIVEPTSGNTGIGLALVCAMKGYRLILTMPESMSLERRSLLEAYGAELILTPAERAMDGAVERAVELCATNSDFFMPQQFSNPANPEIHRHSTAPEIVNQLDHQQIDAFVAAVGTGGTVSGIGAILKARFGTRVIAVEPTTSAVISGHPPGPHKIQGIGAGFVPDNYDRIVVDEVRLCDERRAYDTKTRLAKQEGLLLGISAGANVAIALEVAQELGAGKTVVTIGCDTGERYFSLDEYFQN